ncbi:unnamed protein product, partial [Musa acuminata var. zebrina]
KGRIASDGVNHHQPRGVGGGRKEKGRPQRTDAETPPTTPPIDEAPSSQILEKILASRQQGFAVGED